jgi:hypothetical protein
MHYSSKRHVFANRGETAWRRQSLSPLCPTHPRSWDPVLLSKQVMATNVSVGNAAVEAYAVPIGASGRA